MLPKVWGQGAPGLHHADATHRFVFCRTGMRGPLRLTKTVRRETPQTGSATALIRLAAMSGVSSSKCEMMRLGS